MADAGNIAPEGPASHSAILFHLHNCRSRGTTERRLVEIHQAVPAVLDEALIQSAVVMVKVLIALDRSSAGRGLQVSTGRSRKLGEP